MLKRFSFLVAAAIGMAATVTAQQPCATDDHHREMLKANPGLAAYEAQFNEQIGRAVAARTTGVAPDTAYYDFPIVVHIVHDYGTENVSDDDVFEATANWAKAFVKQNADTVNVIDPFIPYIGNARLRLHMATIDPNGNPTKGIVRHNSYLTYTASDQAKYQSWPNNKYINIWFIKSFGTSTAAAYAYYPASGATRPNYDGVIGLSTYLNYSKTIPHELGHVLNLQHVWGNTNSAGDACGDDEVDDTPPTKGHTPGCVPIAIFDTACATGYMKTYTSSLGVDSVADYPDTTNAQNIMDYTYCANMFTWGQCHRMRQAMTSSVAGRNNLITSSNLAMTGALAERPDLPPVAEFTVTRALMSGLVTDSKTRFLTFNNEASFVFKNASWNDTIASVSWDFSNGATTPTSTSTATVSNRFSVPGWVSVSLTATSNAGSNTVVENTAVYAADTVVAGGMGYSQPFTSAGYILNWPMMNYYNNQFRWEFYDIAGHNDNSCIRYRSYDTSARIYGTASGDYDDIFTPAFDLNGVTGDVFMNFFTSGAVRTGSSSSSRDSLEVDVSTTGGVRWTKIGGFRGTDLANNGGVSGEFKASASSPWKGRSVNVDPMYRTSQTFFRIRYRPGNSGNNLYLDDVSIGSLPVEVQDLAKAGTTFVMYPNPSATGTNVVYNTGNDGTVHIVIRDVAGKLVFETVKNVTPNSTSTEFIPRAAVPSAGLYFISVVNGGNGATQKMVIY